MIDWVAIGLSVKLAGITSALLLALGLPLAWWICFSARRARRVVEALGQPLDEAMGGVPAAELNEGEHRAEQRPGHQRPDDGVIHPGPQRVPIAASRA